MRNVLVFGSCLLVSVITSVLLSDSTIWGQDQNIVTSKGKAGKNLQVLAIDSVGDLQNAMKTITKSLGTDCKFCHDLKDFAMDVESLKKDRARYMMNMVNEINEKFFKDSEAKITCFTCHQGHKEPILSLADWEKMKEEESQ